jgi:TetR/AcrR family transcriptional repressor of nem operon
MLNRFTNGEGLDEMGGTRSELLARAEVLIRCRGYNGFSYADLAREVGVRTATIHYYFPTKKDLGLQLIASYDEKYDAALKEIISSTRGGLDRVASYAELYLSGLEQELGCLCAVLAITPEFLPAEMRAAVGQFFKKHFRWLEMVIREGRADGSIRPDADPALQARLIITLLEGGLLMERMLDGPGGFKCSIAALKSQLEGSTAALQSRSHPGSVAAELN